jgi:sigma-E factor negative regulatory protein RseB
MRRALPGALSATLLMGVAGALHAQTTPEALGWLRKIYEATQKLSYSGTFVYQQGDRSETSRITRLVERDGATERLEVLDGRPRVIVRTRDAVRCYYPGSRRVKVDRGGDLRTFPALLPEQVASLAENYTITMGETARVAGYDCRAVMLAPKDDLRYGYQLWADAATGMLLKARTVNDKGAVVEQFTFTQLDIGNVERDRLKLARIAGNWRVEDAAVVPVEGSQSGWRMAADLPGFRRVAEVRRRLRESRLVHQVVFSDGLAAVSVFIEPLEGRREPVRVGLANMGAINMYRREVANHLVTVVGETPAASVQRIGNTVEYRGPAN